MDPRAFRVAQQFVRAHLRQARYAPEFLQWVEGRRFPNPNPRGRLKDVKFDSLPDEHQKRIYEQWRGQKAVQEQQQQRQKPQTREEIQQQAIDIARHGKETDRRVLSQGGRGTSGPINQSFIVKLEKDGQSQVYIHKPAEGEEPHLRIGIPGGEYHAREQAAYTIDNLIGGRGIVPVTQTRGNDDGSYQLWAKGARQMHGEDMDELVGKVPDELVGKVPVEDLARNQDFQRLNVLDLLTGHEDRHRGNLLFNFDGDETPENLRLIAIDNGLSMASPSESRDHRVYVNPFAGWYTEPEGAGYLERKELQDAGKRKGDKVVAKSLSRIDPELHDQLEDVDMKAMAKAMTDAGIAEEGAVRAALVRLAALQADPTIFKDMLDRNEGNLGDAWRDFQHLSGYKDDLLWRSGAGDKEDEINAAMETARPRGGWKKAISLEEANKAMQDLDGWGQTSPADAPTAKPGAPNPHSEIDWAKMATNVKDRWLVAKVTGRRGGRTLTVSLIDMRTRKPREVGSFTLDRNNKVKESYKDPRFRQDIRRGIRLLGKVIKPEDGPRFMGALEKVYGARSMYDVRRT